MSLRPADRRRAVEELLRDEEWREWNDRQIARHCGVDGHRELGTIKARPARQKSPGGAQLAWRSRLLVDAITRYHAPDWQRWLTVGL
jgi:hypothetical protein